MAIREKGINLGALVTWLLQYILVIGAVAAAMSYGYWRLGIEPKVDAKIEPIKTKVTESYFLLQEIVPAEARERVRVRMQCLKELE